MGGCRCGRDDQLMKLIIGPFLELAREWPAVSGMDTAVDHLKSWSSRAGENILTRGECNHPVAGNPVAANLGTPKESTINSGHERLAHSGSVSVCLAWNRNEPAWAIT